MLVKLNPLNNRTAIYECEFFALVCAFMTSGNRLGGAAVFYTDNNAVRDALISCNSSNKVAKGLLISVLALECVQQVTPWYARVPTDSYMSDAPSRMETSHLNAMGAIHDALDLERCWVEHSALLGQWGEDRASSTTQR